MSNLRKTSHRLISITGYEGLCSIYPIEGAILIRPYDGCYAPYVRKTIQSSLSIPSKALNCAGIKENGEKLICFHRDESNEIILHRHDYSGTFEAGVFGEGIPDPNIIKTKYVPKQPQGKNTMLGKGSNIWEIPASIIDEAGLHRKCHVMVTHHSLDGKHWVTIENIPPKTQMKDLQLKTDVYNRYMNTLPHIDGVTYQIYLSSSNTITNSLLVKKLDYKKSGLTGLPIWVDKGIYSPKCVCIELLPQQCITCDDTISSMDEKTDAFVCENCKPKTGKKGSIKKLTQLVDIAHEIHVSAVDSNQMLKNIEDKTNSPAILSNRPDILKGLDDYLLQNQQEMFRLIELLGTVKAGIA